MNSRFFTLNQAAKEAGKSPSTIHRSLNNGKLSYMSKDNDGYKIDPAELFRVFPKKGIENTKIEQSGISKEQQQNTEIVHKNIRLESELKAAIEMIETLKADKTFLQDELKKSTSLIADMRINRPEKPVQGNKRFLWWKRTSDS